MKDVEFTGLCDQRRQGDRPPAVAPASQHIYDLQVMPSKVHQRIKSVQKRWLESSHAEAEPC